MRRVLIPLVLLATLGACSSADDNADSTQAVADPVAPVPNEPQVAVAPEPEQGEPAPDEPAPGGSEVEAGGSDLPDDPSASAISVDNHVDLLRNVFAIYSAKIYGDELLSAPDYSDPFFDGIPDLDEEGNPISPTVELVCSNGGTATIVPESTGFYIDNVVSWDFTFDNCQDGTALLDGQIKRQIYEEILITSEGFTRDEQTRVKRFSGRFYRASRGSPQAVEADVYTEAASFSLSGPTASLMITEATSELNTSDDGSDMRGGFVVQADWTNGQPIAVNTTREFIDDRAFSEAGRPIRFRTGRLELSDGSGNRLELQADTGDIDTVEITVTAGGSSETFIAPWQPWEDAFIFVSESGF